MSCKKVLVGYFKRFVYTSTPIVLTQKHFPQDALPRLSKQKRRKMPRHSPRVFHVFKLLTLQRQSLSSPSLRHALVTLSAVTHVSFVSLIHVSLRQAESLSLQGHVSLTLNVSLVVTNNVKLSASPVSSISITSVQTPDSENIQGSQADTCCSSLARNSNWTGH